MVEPGEELGAPGGESAAEAGDLGDGAGAGGGDELFGGGSSGGSVGVGVRGHEVLGDDPGGGHFVVRVAGQQRREEPGALLDGEPVRAAAQQPAGPEQRVLGEAAVPEGVLLGAAADLVDAGQGEFHDMKGIEEPDRQG